MLPHHHHEETVCFTKVHCESELNEDSHNMDEHAKHSHDNSSGDNSQHCMSLEYYVKSDFGKDNKKLIKLSLLEYGFKKFNILYSFLNPKDKDIQAKEKQFEFLKKINSYTVFVRKNLPLRAPPSLS